jgi:FkbM family methyltransferase
MDLIQQGKSIIARTLNRFGYSVRQLCDMRGNLAVDPRVQKVRIRDVEFLFWVANERSLHGYGEEAERIRGTEGGALLDLARPGDRVIEVGSNQGFFTMVLGRAVGKDGFVLAADACSYNTMICHAQIGLNELGGTCIARQLALSDRPGHVTIDNSINSQVIADGSPGGTRVPATTIDDLDREHGPFDLLKIDVEGYEGKVLAGARRTLERRPRIALEVHDNILGRHGDSIETLTRGIGPDRYNTSMISEGGIVELGAFDPSRLPRNRITNLFLTPRE